MKPFSVDINQQVDHVLDYLIVQYVMLVAQQVDVFVIQVVPNPNFLFFQLIKNFFSLDKPYFNNRINTIPSCIKYLFIIII